MMLADQKYLITRSQRLIPYLTIFLLIVSIVLVVFYYKAEESHKVESAKLLQKQAEEFAKQAKQSELEIAKWKSAHEAISALAASRLTDINDLKALNSNIEKKYTGLDGQHKALKDEHTALKTKARTVATNQIGRSLRGVKRHIATAAGKAAPVAGVAVVAAATLVDVMDACEAMREMESLSGPDDGIGSKIAEACKQHVPTTDDLATKVKGGWRRAYDSAMSHVPNRKPLSSSTESASDAAEKLLR
jgi:hypothetical protein